MQNVLFVDIIYNPEEGDPVGGVVPGTAFEDIDPEWKCPSAEQERKSSKKQIFDFYYLANYFRDILQYINEQIPEFGW